MVMPFVWRNKTGKPRFTSVYPIAKMSLDELQAYEEFLWECTKKLPNSPTIIDTLNAIYREVEYRAQDPWFK